VYRGWVKDGTTKTRSDFPYTKMKLELYGVANLGSATGTEVDLNLVTTGKDRSEGEIFNCVVKKVTYSYKVNKKEETIEQYTTIEVDLEYEDSRVSGLVGREVTMYVE
jgi:hypothetical protein